MNVLLRAFCLIGLLPAVCTFSLFAQESPSTANKSAPSILSAIRNLTTLDAPAPLSGDNVVAQIDDQQYLVVNMEFVDAESCRAFDDSDVKFITKFDRFADAFVLADEAVFIRVQSAAGLVWLDWNSNYLVPPPARPVPGKEKQRQIADRIVRGGIDELTGEGVVVAIIDTGIDFRHQDFFEHDARGQPVSRVFAYWDTTSDMYANGVGNPGPLNYPNGAPIGSVYLNDLLTADLRTPHHEIPIWDANGHGTACAGIAAGNGNASNGKYQGVAPKADIIAVRVASGNGNQFDNTYLIGAICDWLNTLAGDRPVVVSCSYGGHLGGHDGSSIIERQISARFSLDRQSRAICIAAGNSGTEAMHTGFDVGKQSEEPNVSWIDPQSDGALLVLYAQTAEIDDIVLEPGGESNIRLEQKYVNALTNHAVFEFAVAGPGGVHVYSKAGQKYAADAYILSGAFDQENAKFTRMIGTPSAAANAITVGSYDWNDKFHFRGSLVEFPDMALNTPLRIGGLSSYSSPGPSRLGQVKPEIAAPGQWFTAPLSSNKPAVIRESSGHYEIFNGTSAATPYTAGIIALLFEKNPKLTNGAIKELLKTCATQDIKTGAVPNNHWGYGKLDYAAVRKIVDSVEE